MYFLLCLATLGVALGVPLTNEVFRDASTLYVLPTETFPTFYDVRLFLNPNNPDYFFGNVSITILANIPTNRIVLHAMEMNIDDVKVVSDSNPDTEIFLNYNLATDDTHFLTLELTEELQPLQPYTVNISYTGQYATNMFGIYVSTYEENGAIVSLVTSQLQPTFARRAFPCYDEPALKAVFRTTIYAPPEYSVIRSNTDIRNNALQDEVPGWIKHEFEDTPVMSTYLIAYLVSNFNYIDNGNNTLYHVPFRVYSRPGTQAFAEFALDFGQRNMMALEDYIEFPYVLPKMDKAAVPDFAAGAMENWGLVIYREAALLVQEGVTTTSVRQNIGRIICHENVHQWFGNEVSPQSWTYTWLNEGFANFFENYATDLVLPRWRMMDQFVLAMQNVFQADAVLSVNPMTHLVYTPSEILGTFNAVAYQKSGSVIRMVQHFMTPEVFRQGLVTYIQNNTRSSASPTELFAALQQAMDAANHTTVNINTVLTPWTTQAGFPVLDVRRVGPDSQSITITQTRYLTDNNLTSTYRWHIPINWVISTNPDFEDTAPQSWVLPVSMALAYEIEGLTEAEWFIVNKQQTGYYRVNYEPSNWEALSRQLRSNHELIHVLNRAQLLDDSFNLARTERLGYRNALELSSYLEQESDYIPWGAANRAFIYLDIVLRGSSQYDTFKNYLLKLTAPLYASLGFEVSETEEHVTPFLRNIILDINCRLGNENCLNHATKLLQDFKNNPNNRLNPDIQATVYCSALRQGDPADFNFLWNQYIATSDSTEKSILLNALGCTTNGDRRDFYLNEVLNDESPVRQQDKHTIIVSVINSSPENMEVALEFCYRRWPDIQPRVQGLTGTTNILNAFASRLTTQEQSKRIEQFVTRHSDIFTAGELAAIGAIRENIAASIRWGNENAGVVESWLIDNYGSNAIALSANLLVLMSVVITLLNR